MLNKLSLFLFIGGLSFGIYGESLGNSTSYEFNGHHQKSYNKFPVFVLENEGELANIVSYMDMFANMSNEQMESLLYAVNTGIKCVEKHIEKVFNTRGKLFHSLHKGGFEMSPTEKAEFRERYLRISDKMRFFLRGSIKDSIFDEYFEKCVIEACFNPDFSVNVPLLNREPHASKGDKGIRLLPDGLIGQYYGYGWDGYCSWESNRNHWATLIVQSETMCSGLLTAVHESGHGFACNCLSCGDIGECYSMFFESLGLLSAIRTGLVLNDNEIKYLCASAITRFYLEAKLFLGVLKIIKELDYNTNTISIDDIIAKMELPQSLENSQYVKKIIGLLLQQYQYGFDSLIALLECMKLNEKYITNDKPIGEFHFTNV